MSITQITDHSDAAVARLAEQFKEKTRISGLIQAFIDQYQLTENMFFDLLNFRSINSAVGAQLDILGAIVGEDRRGRTDEPYRKAIVAKIGINTSKGTPEEVIAIFKFVTNATRVFYLETYPGEIEIYSDVNIEYTLSGNGEDAFAFDGGIDGLGFGDIFDSAIGGTMAYLETNDVIAVYILCDSVIPGGVRLNYVGWFDGDEAFSFDGDTLSKGFGDALDLEVGGKFAEIVEHHMPFSFYSESKRALGFGDVRDNLIGGEFASV